MSCRFFEISSETGTSLIKKLAKLIKDKENWKGGKQYKFNFKHCEQEFQIFKIKACKKALPIEDAVKFGYGDEETDMSWDNDTREAIISDENFAGYFHDFMTKKIHTFVEDAMKVSQPFRICVMLVFEIARWNLEGFNDPEELISMVLNKDPLEEEEVILLFKSFPKADTKTDNDRRTCAYREIFRRHKQMEIDDIYKRWPPCESDENILEILTGNESERTYAFQKFLKRKTKRNEILLQQKKDHLEFFKTILSSETSIEDAERAFEQLNIRLKKKEEE